MLNVVKLWSYLPFLFAPICIIFSTEYGRETLEPVTAIQDTVTEVQNDLKRLNLLMQVSNHLPSETSIRLWSGQNFWWSTQVGKQAWRRFEENWLCMHNSFLFCLYIYLACKILVHVYFRTRIFLLISNFAVLNLISFSQFSFLRSRWLSIC